MVESAYTLKDGVVEMVGEWLVRWEECSNNIEPDGGEFFIENWNWFRLDRVRSTG